MEDISNNNVELVIKEVEVEQTPEPAKSTKCFRPVRKYTKASFKRVSHHKKK